MSIPAGLIFRIAAGAGVGLRGNGAKRACRCPFHEDRNASAFVSASNVFFCSVCTPGKGWTAKQFSEALGQSWRSEAAPFLGPTARVAEPRTGAEVKFTASDAAAVWAGSFVRAHDDEMVDRDRDVHDYAARRGLGEALDLGAYGVLSPSGLHPTLAQWPSRGYRLVAPLFDLQGQVASIQARAIVPAKIKVMNPTGSRVAGTVFADRGGQRVLAGEQVERVVFGEGLTDMIALALASPWPVLAAPGTSNAVNAVGAWASGAEVLLALDSDAAGEAAVQPVAERLGDHGARRVRRVVWPGGAKDACDVLEQRGLEALQSFLSGLGGAP